MRKIFPLPAHLISKIAAGEVIERPAYVVKELIENSLDANATAITIDIKESGLKTIQITDNGEGMSRKDLEEAVKIHTTSKVKHEDTLVGIKSFGFRGEALASIGAVSTLTIKSRTPADSGGTKIVVKNGKVESIGAVGAPIGTTILVERLFSHVPARKKFLKSSKTEFRHILDIVIKYALVHSDIRFKLTHNQKTVFDLTENDDVKKRIKVLLGELIHNNFLPLQFEDGGINLTGFIGHPQIATTKPTKQYIFVNNRAITSKIVSTAVSESFQTLIPRDQYAAFVLFLKLPFEAVDVNVHPRKEFVTFFDDKKIFDTIKSSILETLSKYNLSFSVIPWKIKDGRITESFAGQLLREESQNWDITTLGKIKSNEVLQFNNTYLITGIDSGIILIDQHAAHERILYEKFTKAFKNKKKNTFKLKERIGFDLPLADVEILRLHIDTFKKLGFDIEEFYENSFRINSVPEVFKDRNIGNIINELIEELLEKKRVSDIDSLTQKMLAFLSCRSAVMAGDKLTKDQMKKLIEELEDTSNNSTCPHGRPTKISLSLHDLHKMFKRE